MSIMKKRLFGYRSMTWILLALCIISSMCIGGTYAYLKWTAAVENKIEADKSEIPNIKETFTNNEKTDVSVFVGNTEYAVYVRAAIVATWVNQSGEVHAKVPVVDKDYTLELNVETPDNQDAPWFKADDGFYYHKEVVESEKSTKVLIESCKPLRKAPAHGYILNVEIIAQTIQAAGMTDGVYDTNGNVIIAPIQAVTSAWGVTVNDSDTTISQ